MIMKLSISERYPRLNMRVITAILCVVVCGYVLGCSVTRGVNHATPSAPGSSPEKPFPVADYQFTSYDDKGDKVSEGKLSITSAEVRRINSEEVTQLKGNWELKKVGNQERVGLQEGKSELVGSIDKDEIIINLNPNISDANVYLRGKIEGKRFHGTWSFNGIAGPVTKGTFEATKQ